MSDPLQLPSDWRERALETLRDHQHELLGFTWELAWREGWTQCAELAKKQIEELEKINQSH